MRVITQGDRPAIYTYFESPSVPKEPGFPGDDELSEVDEVCEIAKSQSHQVAMLRCCEGEWCEVAVQSR